MPMVISVVIVDSRLTSPFEDMRAAVVVAQREVKTSHHGPSPEIGGNIFSFKLHNNIKTFDISFEFKKCVSLGRVPPKK